MNVRVRLGLLGFMLEFGNARGIMKAIVLFNAIFDDPPLLMVTPIYSVKEGKLHQGKGGQSWE